MKYQLTEKEYVRIQDLCDMQDYLNAISNERIGYTKIKELLNAYRCDNIEIVE